MPYTPLSSEPTDADLGTAVRRHPGKRFRVVASIVMGASSGTGQFDLYVRRSTGWDLAATDSTSTVLTLIYDGDDGVAAAHVVQTGGTLKSIVLRFTDGTIDAGTAVNGTVGALIFTGPGVEQDGNTFTFSGVGAGVSDINGETGSITFTGSGVMQGGTTFTFSGASSLANGGLKTSSFNAAAGTAYDADTTTRAVVMTLPALSGVPPRQVVRLTHVAGSNALTAVGSGSDVILGPTGSGDVSGESESADFQANHDASAWERV